MVAGVYWILNLVNGKVYIGSSVDVENRLQNHKKDLIAGNHRNPYLQRAWDKQPDSTLWNFEILEEVVDEIWLRARESAWILRLQSHLRDTGYNAAQNGWDGGTWPGQVEACRAAGKKRVGTEKFDRWKNSRVGAIVFEETRAKSRDSLARRKSRGEEIHKFTEEDQAKSLAASIGRKKSVEELRLMSEGVKKSWTPERRAAQSERARKQIALQEQKPYQRKAG
jgi:group I intron endonuclease